MTAEQSGRSYGESSDDELSNILYDFIVEYCPVDGKEISAIHPASIYFNGGYLVSLNLL